MIRYRHKSFEGNHTFQPLPRSSYHRDYLSYSSLKAGEESLRHRDNQILLRKDYYSRRSTYSEDFGREKSIGLRS